MMRQERSYEVRVAMLDALLHTSPSVLSAVVHAGSFTSVRALLLLPVCHDRWLFAVLPACILWMSGSPLQGVGNHHKSGCCAWSMTANVSTNALLFQPEDIVGVSAWVAVLMTICRHCSNILKLGGQTHTFMQHSERARVLI